MVRSTSQGTWNDNHATGDSINYDLETGHRSAEHYTGRGEKPMPNPEHAIVDPLDGKVPTRRGPWPSATRTKRATRIRPDWTTSRDVRSVGCPAARDSPRRVTRRFFRFPAT
jgi:hypothetical protein